jgi:hypothetical protein
VCLFILFGFMQHGKWFPLIALSLAAAAICLPSAFFALVTGIYPVNRGRNIYRYYHDPKPSYRKNFLLTHLPILRMVGLLQLVMMAGVVILFVFTI